MVARTRHNVMFARTLRALVSVTRIHVSRSAIRSFCLITVTVFDEERYKGPHYLVFLIFVLVFRLINLKYYIGHIVLIVKYYYYCVTFIIII